MDSEMQDYLRNEQYKTADNLSARMDVHHLYSRNKHGWFQWVFDQFDLPPEAHILELACGRGDLWNVNMRRIPAGWKLTLTDFSEGMLTETKARLTDAPRPFNFKQADIQSIPFEDGKFDAVIANHMLYHVPNKPRAFREILRVLKSNGRFYAATVGENHLRELTKLVNDFYGADAFDFAPRKLDFILENGAAQLESFFKNVQLHRYEDSLEVTQAESLVNYVLSGYSSQSLKPRADEFRAFVAQEIKTHGAIHIFKDSGMFIANKTAG